STFTLSETGVYETRANFTVNPNESASYDLYISNVPKFDYADGKFAFYLVNESLSESFRVCLNQHIQPNGKFDDEKYYKSYRSISADNLPAGLLVFLNDHEICEPNYDNPNWHNTKFLGIRIHNLTENPYDFVPYSPTNKINFYVKEE